MALAVLLASSAAAAERLPVSVGVGVETAPSTHDAVQTSTLRRIVSWIRSRRGSSQQDVVQEQLADALAALAAASRSGLSIPQAIEVVGAQTADPVGASMREVAERTGLGSSLDDALERWATAVPVPDVRLAAAVLQLHRRTGGELPDVLDRLARTMRQRRSLVREVRSLTAQARLSGAILGVLPIGFFLFSWFTSRGDMAAALTSPTGRAAVMAGLALQGIAALWIRHLLRVEP